MFKRVLIIASGLIFLLACGSQKNIQPHGTDSKKAYVLFGEALLAHDIMEDDKALELLAKAIKLDPTYIEAYDLQGNIYLGRKQYDEATASFQRILSLDPDHVYALTDLSKVQFLQHDYDDCLRNLNRVLKLVGRSDKREEILRLIENATFAKESYNNPVPFNPRNLGPSVNSSFEDYFPGLSIDEQSLYFTRRDGSIHIYKQNEDIYVSQKKDTSWNLATNLGQPINTDENEGAFSASPDGKYLLFTSCSRVGGVGRCDIWQTRLVGDKWTEPTNLGMPVNTREWESQPSMAADGKTLYFVSNRPGGFGGTDIWKSIRKGDNWTRPENLGPEINTTADEEFPFIHSDGKTLYFTSKGLPGMGSADIFVTRNKDGVWQTPVNLGYPINTDGDEWNFIVNRTGDKAYFASNGIKGGYGGMDIYEIDLYAAARPSSTSYVKGIVFDVETKKKLRAEVELFNLSTNELAASTHSDASSGSFILSLPANNNYAFEARAEGYLFHSENFELSTASLDEPFVLEIGLKRIKNDISWVMKNVLFDVNEAILKSESFYELDLLVGFLNNNPKLDIEIGGHTDNTGTEAINKALSENRAKAVYNFLVTKGIPSSRLTYAGYGSSKAIATNETPEGRSLNRRTEVKILKSE
ncbi:MAG: outer membrane protein OmpA-like peptidoglycan-associated protein [Bacteroidia bacterium]|jgi:outer membrane protein OmpA-like peptidoglycan-associated protein